jgi:fibronectin type 3 domain-containing protein
MLEILIGTGQPPATSDGDSSDVGDGDAARGPGAPTGVIAVRNPEGSTDVRVSWNAVSGATGYRVYWSETYSGSGTLKGSPTTTSFTVTGNRTDATHYFRVTAVNSDGEGTASSWISVGPVSSTPTPTRLGAPTGVTAARTPADSTDVRVTWNAVSGATSYRVYYSGTGTDSGTREGSPTATSFTSTGNYTDRTHYFRVSAVNSAGEGTPSSWVSVGPVSSTSGGTATPTPTPQPTPSSGGPTNWTKVSNSPFGNNILEAVAYGNNRFVAGSRGGTMAYSADGERWTAVSNSRFGDESINGIAYGGNRFVAVGDSGTIAYSSDGVTWTAAANSTIWNRTDPGGYTWAVHISNVAYGSNRFVAVGMYGKMAYSADGRSWTAVANSRFGESDIIAVVYGSNRFVAVGEDGKMTYSADGASWTAVSNSRFGSSAINGIAYSGDRFVAVGEDGKMASSSDGASWTAVSNSRFDGSTIWDITYGNNRFVAVGSGKMAYSADGITWTAVANSPSDDDIYGIAYGGNRFVTVGWDGITYADW